MNTLVLWAALALYGEQTAADPSASRVLTIRAALERALEASPAAVRAQDEIAAAEAQRDATRSLVLPRVNVTGSLIRNSEEVSFGSLEDRRTILPSTDWSARVTLQQPIYAGRREFRLYYQAKEGITLSREARAQTRDRIALRVIADYAAAVEAQALVRVEREASELATKRIAQAHALFEAGEVTRVDILRAETANRAALRRVAAAEAEAIQARSRLRMALAIDGGDSELGALDEETVLGLPVAAVDTLEARDLYEQREATALDLEAAESALSEARRALVQSRFAVLQAEANVWLAGGALADRALENFK